MSPVAFVVLTGPRQGDEIIVEGEFVFGRDSRGVGDLRGDSDVSRRHARIRVDPRGQVSVEDLGSTNGTMLNGYPITRTTPLREGDVLTCGQTAMRVERRETTAPYVPPALPAEPGASGPALPGAPPGLALPGAPPGLALPGQPPPGQSPPEPSRPGEAPYGLPPVPAPVSLPSYPAPPPVAPYGAGLPPAAAPYGVGPPPASPPLPASPPPPAVLYEPEPGAATSLAGSPQSPPSGSTFGPAGPRGPFGPGGPAGPVGPTPPGWVVRMSRGGGRRAVALAVVGALIAVAAGVGVGYLLWGRKKAAPATAPPGIGTVYVESNIAASGANTVLAFRYGAAGNLTPLSVRSYPTGGAGSADLTDSGVLDADQHLLYVASRKLLFAVNQGSDTVAVFHVAADGALTAVSGSPFPSGGKAPASVGISGNTVIVVNKAQDGVRKLDKDRPNYTTFRLAGDGRLTPTGSTISAPPGYSPTQALVSTDGKVVISTEEGGPLRAFALSADGKLTQGPNSPMQLPDSQYPKGFPAAKKWALGLGVNPHDQLLYAQMATVSKMAVYRYDDTGRLTFVTAVPNPGAELPCWTLVNSTGTRIYTDNAGNNTMSVYDISNPTAPRQIQLVKLKNDGNPWDVQFDPTQKMIFMIDPRARMNVPPGRGNELHTLLINSDGTLREPSYSPVPIPVGYAVNPIGVAVVADR